MIKKIYSTNNYNLGAVLSSGCTTNDNIKHWIKWNSYNYPFDWIVADTQSNKTIAAVGNPEFIDNTTGLGLVSVNIQYTTIFK